MNNEELVRRIEVALRQMVDVYQWNRKDADDNDETEDAIYYKGVVKGLKTALYMVNTTYLDEKIDEVLKRL